MMEFRNRNVFGATAFCTYGAFWMGLFAYVQYAAAGSKSVSNDLGWILLAFAIFNTYMLLWSTKVNGAVFAVSSPLR
jgi:succinate-acetate transporter protein